MVKSRFERKVLVSSDEEDEEKFSADETDNENSSDEGRAKKKRERDSSDSSNSDSGFLGKKSNKKRSKDDPLSLNTSEKKRKLPKKNIALLSENEIRDRYRYKKHTCQLSDLPTKTKKPIGKSCRPGHPEDLKAESVKLHYVVHYKENGYWDHIVPEEGDKAGKIDCYECQVCDKKFKNALEKQGPGSSAGRGSAICHVATDHGRLLEALLNEEKDMTKEIEWLAEHDKGFNDGYREYFNSKKQLFGLPDDQIVTSRESLVWKIYAKKHAEAKKNESQNVISPKKSPMKDKENSDPNERVSSNSSARNTTTKRPKKTQIELGKLKKLECPFKNDDPEKICKLTEKQKIDHHDFRMHFFLHYRNSNDWVISHWTERLKSLEKGDQLSMYCDLCSIRKRIKAATENGLRNSMICHLAVIHGELRNVMEKDERLTKEFIKNVFYDVDLKKLEESGADIPSPQKSPEKTTQDEKIKENYISPKAGVNGYKPGPKSKTRPGPKSRTKPWDTPVAEKEIVKEPSSNDDSDEVDDPDEIPEISSDESDLEESETQPEINKRSSASKNDSVTKNKQRSPNPLKANKEVVRKRRPINFTIDDLNGDEVEDESWRGSPKSGMTKSAEAKRVLPRRQSRGSAVKKPAYSEDESD